MAASESSLLDFYSKQTFGNDIHFSALKCLGSELAQIHEADSTPNSARRGCEHFDLWNTGFKTEAFAQASIGLSLGYYAPRQIHILSFWRQTSTLASSPFSSSLLLGEGSGLPRQDTHKEKDSSGMELETFPKEKTSQAD